MTTRLLLLALLALLPAFELLRLLTATPPLVLLAAVTPAALLAMIVVLSARGRGRGGLEALGAFACGATVGALLSSTFNALLQAWIAVVAGEENAHRLVPTFAAPVVEELSKAAALVLALALGRRKVRDVGDGIFYAVLVGIGFVMTENLQYFLLAAVQGGTSGLLTAVYLRALLGGMNHAIFTAATGAGIAWGRRAATNTIRFAAPFLGLLAAIVQHVLWNAVASRELARLLCNPAVEGGSCRGAPDAVSLLIEAPLIEAVFVGPGLVALVFLIRAARRRRR